jgi:hypothetical protein
MSDSERIKLTSFEETWEVFLQRVGSDERSYTDRDIFHFGAYAALGVFANRLAVNSTTSIQELSEQLSKAITELERIIDPDEIR